MMDIELHFTDRVKITSDGSSIRRADPIKIDFGKFLHKQFAEFEIEFKEEFDDYYKINISTYVCYNVKTLEFFKSMESNESKHYFAVYDAILNRSYDKQIDAHLYNQEYLIEKDDKKRTKNIQELTTKQCGLSEDKFTYTFKFDKLEDVLQFIKYYDELDDDYNILDDYYHISFVKNRDYDNYLKTKHWNNKREGAKYRAKNKCQFCSNKNNLHVHHNTYKNIGNEKDEDLVVLCQLCHSRQHNK